MTPGLLSPLNWFKPGLKNFEGGAAHILTSRILMFDHLSLAQNVRLLLSYCRKAKVFSCFSLLISMYSWKFYFFRYTGYGSVLCWRSD